MATVGTRRPGSLTPEQIGQIRRWARRIGPDAGERRLREASRTILLLADEALRLRGGEDGGGWDWDETAPASHRLTHGKIDDARALAGRIAGNGAGDELRAAARAITLLCDDLERSGNGSSRRPPSGPRTRSAAGGARPSSPLVVVSALAAVGLALLVFVILRALAPSLDPQGPAAGAVIGAAALADLEFSISGDARTASDAKWSLDGAQVERRPAVAGERVVLRLPKLDDGRHELRVSLPGVAPWSSSAASWSFTVDTTAPKIELPGDILKATVRMPFTVEGTATGAVRMTVDGKQVPLDGGRFTLSAPEPPAAPLEIVAVDAAGNRAERTIPVRLTPRYPSHAIRAVHVSADAWASKELRDGILAMIDAKKINTVELDLKDEAGVVGWDAPVPLAKEIGAVRDTFDLAGAVRQLHKMGVRVVGRLVVFRDPILARAAWKGKQRDRVIQTPDGEPYTGGYDAVASFTNFANEAVRRYNIDIAVAAAKLGVDDILYDYIRRPDGPLDTMVFPGFEGDPADAIVSFLGESRKSLAKTETLLGASVFGIAVTRPDEIAQDIGRMATEVDYVAPMVYPSHWGPEEYGLSNPESQPYEIVAAVLADYEKAVRGTGARVVPWLQDFSLAVEYGPDEVAAQIDAASDVGIDEWLLWDPAVTYTASAITPNAKLPTTGLQPASVTGIRDPNAAAASGAASDASVAEGPGPVTDLAPNELGQVPVLMYHQFLPDGGSEYDLTPAEFREELERLYEEGYRPIRASDLVNGTIDVPAGTTPVVMTFDDSTNSQAALTASGEIDPDTAVGIMFEFARSHPGFVPAGTFYVNGDPFAAGSMGKELAAWLTGHGFELANHTRDHLNLSELSAKGVQQQFVLGDRVIHDVLPEAEVATMALPFGVMPNDEQLAVSGSWDGEEYAFGGVMLVGAEPAPSPFSQAFAPYAIPRIRSDPSATAEYGSGYWLDILADDPGRRFVSDGDPATVTVPEGREGELAEAWAAKARAA